MCASADILVFVFLSKYAFTFESLVSNVSDSQLCRMIRNVCVSFKCLCEEKLISILSTEFYILYCVDKTKGLIIHENT